MVLHVEGVEVGEVCHRVVGEAVATDKQVNGFKLAYTGSAKSAVVEYIVIGGIIA